MAIAQPARWPKLAVYDALVVLVAGHGGHIQGKKNGPPLAQGARRGVLAPSGIATGGGGAYPRYKPQVRHPVRCCQGILEAGLTDGGYPAFL